ncbi:rhodanese-like domain-containing protein [Oceanithermus sp.]|uniref:rhodanese-like domain-containing protein n=1 Tax=Oceanithermus sp. TaxID=2268145 RepID=UPI00257F9783|nr:rhodanese-like domain-containing protein [Oceanithermus sp.]
MNRWAVAALVLGVLALAVWVVAGRNAGAAALPEVPAGGYAEISVSTLGKLLEAPKEERGFVLLNVHVPYAGEIPGTDLLLPYNRLPEFADRLPQDKTTPIVLYCRSGAMSRMAAKTLVQMGYTRVYDVPGGMNAWRASGGNLVFKKR